MERNPLNSVWAFIRRGIDMAKMARNQNTPSDKLSFYRYDSTGRMVHFGPEGEVLENDSAFQVTGARYGQSAKSM